VTASRNESTPAGRSAGDSVLMTLARSALASEGSAADLDWPRLDLDDPEQREFGDYELLEEIGRGGMGVVYRARQRSLDRDVAIKFIASGLADTASVARFLGEARAAARLMHPTIVPVHEVGSIDGVHYFSMPLVRGRSLASLLEDQRLDAGATIALLLKLCDAIDYAHRLGLLHLDLKPANVLLDAQGEPLIADFGLARHMDARGGVDAQEVSGTPSYMAPEQILIKQYRLSRATDLYGLGAILYRCLSGTSPHGEGEPDELIRRAVAGRVRPLSEVAPAVSRDLAAVCMKCLELEPGDRYASAAELANDLRHVRDGLPVSVRRIGWVERTQRWLSREPRLAAALAVALLALLLGAGSTAWQWRQAVAERDATQAARDRAALASELGAHLYAQGDEAKTGEERARTLIAWLRKRLPGDEERQAAALTDFAASVDAERREHAEILLSMVIKVLGADYRQQVIRALQAGTHPDRHVYSAMLAWNDTQDSTPTAQFESALQSALRERPDDAFTWQVAAVFCPQDKPGRRCPDPQAAQTLVRLAPDNMYPWLLLVAASDDEARQRAALREAALRTHFDDYSRADARAYAAAVSAAAVPAPSLIARPARVLAPNEQPESSIAWLEMLQVPRADWRPLMRYCGVMGNRVVDAATRDDCVTIGMRLARSDHALLSRMIGVALVRNLAKDTPLAEEARQVRRQYVYLSAMDEKLSPSQRMGYASARYLEDLASVGEMAALSRRVEFFGMPGQPPADWQPDNPNVLLSARERVEWAISITHAAALQVAEGKYAEAVASLQPVDATIRANLRNAHAWRLPKYLITLGRARTGLREYAAAETTLLEAWELTHANAPASQDARDSTQALVDLYLARDVADPGNGYAAKAAERKRQSIELETAASQ